MSKWSLWLTQEGKSREISQLVGRLIWAGAYNQVGRSLDFTLTVSERESGLPQVECPLGALVQLYEAEGLLFEGYIFSRRRDTSADLLELGCYDRGIYLKRNQGVYQFRNTLPEEIAARVCADFGVEVGELADTGVRVSRSFPGVSLYQIIQTAYTLAGRQNGKSYLLRFHGSRLEVVEKAQKPETLVLRPESNLIEAAVTESIENLTNQVAIYDQNHRLIATKKNEELISLYGLMQAYLQKSDSIDTMAEAERLLADQGVEQKITVTNLGNTSLIAGEAVILREPLTGQQGLFWIDSDTHTWQNGLYQNRLVLNFRNLMDEQSAGSQGR